MYVVKGPVIMFYGPDHEMEEVIAEAGDFFFIPIGAIHGLENPSKTGPADIVTFSGGVGHQKEAGTICVEPRWDKK